MNTNEVMIGDWINTPTGPMRINHISGELGTVGCDEYINMYDPTLIKGLPITEKILRANGFEYHKKWIEIGSFHNRMPVVNLYLLTSKNNMIVVNKTNNKNIVLWEFEVRSNKDIVVHINYVHELQHALRLVGLNELANNFKIK